MRDNNTVSMYSKNSMLLSSYNSRQSQNYSLNFDYPSNWSIDDVVKWLNNISLQEYCEKFRSKNVFKTYFTRKIKIYFFF